MVSEMKIISSVSISMDFPPSVNLNANHWLLDHGIYLKSMLLRVS